MAAFALEAPPFERRLLRPLRYFPFGIIFLVAGKILDMQDPSTLGKKLGWYGITVLSGLFVHGLILLPLFYFILTRKNPFSFIRGLLQAMVIALATSSRSESRTVLIYFFIIWLLMWSNVIAYVFKFYSLIFK